MVATKDRGIIIKEGIKSKHVIIIRDNSLGFSGDIIDQNMAAVIMEDIVQHRIPIKILTSINIYLLFWL